MLLYPMRVSLPFIVSDCRTDQESSKINLRTLYATNFSWFKNRTLRKGDRDNETPPVGPFQALPRNSRQTGILAGRRGSVSLWPSVRLVSPAAAPYLCPISQLQVPNPPQYSCENLPLYHPCRYIPAKSIEAQLHTAPWEMPARGYPNTTDGETGEGAPFQSGAASKRS